ncbi:kinase-like domain-containing protein [Thamnocephalis sphaerospora]|uniref:Kinase-like domain-containing protein n=1 Tax=Thamnocephalis sphaerospora TaxID=78915 RepID=A0A4P9XPI5_9FUNG|nr:kinase-like domain-containing protein [Thamnocephalis sphaerospora]|eukprot:RKP07913.1 kinase-like domain-containing protein [Thamnocephalis sphaerospora]
MAVEVGAKETTAEARRVPPTPVSASVPQIDLGSGSQLYERLGQVGEGTYGKVYKARNRETGQLVALKRIRMETERDGFPITAMREMKLLQSMCHENVLKLYEVMILKGSVYLVFEYMDYDLAGVLAHPKLQYDESHAKCLLRQLLEGLRYLHKKGVLHRDIKGSNLLLNKCGDLKLADFGLARLHRRGRNADYTNRVITLWYRPPELLLGETKYGPEVDVWGAGCIMLELLTGKAPFQGQDEISQLEQVYNTLGTPDTERWPGVVDLPWYHLVRPKEARPSAFRERYASLLSPAALELAEQLLSMNPAGRPSAEEALEHRYFSEKPLACSPASLPCIEGDWHEFESKQRNKRRHGAASTTNNAEARAVRAGTTASGRPSGSLSVESSQTSTAAKRSYDEVAAGLSPTTAGGDASAASPEAKRTAVRPYDASHGNTQAISVTMLDSSTAVDPH